MFWRVEQQQTLLKAAENELVILRDAAARACDVTVYSTPEAVQVIAFQVFLAHTTSAILCYDNYFYSIVTL